VDDRLLLIVFAAASFLTADSAVVRIEPLEAFLLNLYGIPCSSLPSPPASPISKVRGSGSWCHRLRNLLSESGPSCRLKGLGWFFPFFFFWVLLVFFWWGWGVFVWFFGFFLGFGFFLVWFGVVFFFCCVVFLGGALLLSPRFVASFP